jgi:hypothetical protein
MLSRRDDIVVKPPVFDKGDYILPTGLGRILPTGPGRGAHRPAWLTSTHLKKG